MLLIKWKVVDGDSLRWAEYKPCLHTADHKEPMDRVRELCMSYVVLYMKIVSELNGINNLKKP
jgi:hypothetical protein